MKLVAATGAASPPATAGIAVTTDGTVGIGTTTAPAKLTVKGPRGGIPLQVNTSGGLAGLTVDDDRIVSIGVLSSIEPAATHVCTDSVNRLSSCSSSLRYKDGVRPYRGGLDLLARLRPILFAWKGSGGTDVGLAAEQVAEVEPLLVTHNEKGEIQGVKYDQLAVVPINAVNEQQAQIERQQRQMDQMKSLLCSAHPLAEVCRE